MKKGGIGGGNTVSGLVFEKKADLIDILKNIPGYTIGDNGMILFQGNEVAKSLPKNKLYKYLKGLGIEHEKIISKQLLPDEAILVPKDKKLYIIEKKFQGVAGSVDEKLQTSDFKKRQYEKLFSSLGISVEFIFVLSSWFTTPGYADVLNYIRDIGSDYFFENLPLSRLGLPSIDQVNTDTNNLNL